LVHELEHSHDASSVYSNGEFLGEALFNLDYRHNHHFEKMDSLKPIERLPDEVLYRILQLVVHEDYRLGPRASSPWASPEVRNFCLVQKRFKRAYDLRAPPPILRLSNELLENIFENLVQNSGKLIPIDHRASLSVESFQSMPPQTMEDTNITMNLVSYSLDFQFPRCHLSDMW
jgi:hypothetical protein